MQLFAREGMVFSGDSKSVQTIEFDVPQGISELSLIFDYAPRTSRDRALNASLVESALSRHGAGSTAGTPSIEEQRKLVAGLYNEIHNLMNVVLIDPNGRWRGRWDRNPASADGALVLGRDRASKGFEKGSISAGRWSVAIECHGVFGDPVRWTIRVDGKRGDPRWYLGEMHSHTLHSDGAHEAMTLLEKASCLGVDFVCLTDHNTMTALSELDRSRVPLTVIRGCELTTFNGHYPIYGVDELVPWHAQGRIVPLAEIASVVRAKGGLVSVAHPFKLGDPFCTGCRAPEGIDPRDFDLMEVWYRRWDAPESDNRAAYDLWNSYWSKGHRITAVAARDWHGPPQEKPMPGEFPFTAVFASDGSERAILDGLLRGRVVMSGGPIVDLELEEEGMRVGIERLDERAELRMFENGERIHAREVRGSSAIEIEARPRPNAWYRAELWSDGRPRAIGNHRMLETSAT
jgi:hypothetical protein